MSRNISIYGPQKFDSQFYRLAYSDARHERNVLLHYNTVGIKQNRLPNMELFRKIYPLFNLKVYAGMSRKLHFKCKEEYMSHFHHKGYDENRYFCFKNKMFINKSRMGFAHPKSSCLPCPPNMEGKLPEWKEDNCQRPCKPRHRRHHHHRHHHNKHHHSHHHSRSRSPHPHPRHHSRSRSSHHHSRSRSPHNRPATVPTEQLKGQQLPENIIKQLIDILGHSQQGFIIDEVNKTTNPSAPGIPVIYATGNTGVKVIKDAQLPPLPPLHEINLLPCARTVNFRDFITLSDASSIQQVVLHVNQGFDFTMELPSEWKNNTPIVPHIHWAPDTDMHGLKENINLTLILKPINSSFNDINTRSQNIFSQTITIGPVASRINTKTEFKPCVPTNLNGNTNLLIGHLKRVIQGSSYTDDIFVIGLDLMVEFKN